MKTALVLMTFLGCDDSATDCHYLATSQQRWTSIELCDAVSEKELERYANAPYPVVVAVCQTPGEQAPQTAGAQPPATAPATTPQATAAVTPTIAWRAPSSVYPCRKTCRATAPDLRRPSR